MEVGRISKKSVIIACSIVAIAGCGIAYYVNSRERQSGVAWMDSNWLYRRTVSVENSGSSLTNEDVLVRVDSGTLISQGKLQSDCDDFRFTDSNDGTYLSYWIEGGCNTSDTNIWVRIPTLPTGGKNIYMYYGNSSASSGGLSWGGNVYMYSEGSCPSGWTRASEMDNKFLYGSSTFGQTGGSDTHGHNNATCTTSSLTSTNVEVKDSSAYTIHTFTSSGTFVSSTDMNIEVLVVAGGGGGGYDAGGGGGGGGVIYSSALPITQGSYTVTVGEGGAGSASVGGRGSNGGNSSFGNIVVAYGGGGGGSKNNSGLQGGSGGGGGHVNNVGAAGISGQGNAGGTASDTRGGGGGGASGIGASGVSSGNGGTGYLSSISGISQYYGGGGAGGNWNGAGGVGGAGGGGNGGNNSGYSGSEGTPNTGGGGGANGNINSSGGTGKKGGSGIVIIKYRYPTSATGGSIISFSGTDVDVSSLSHTHVTTSGISSTSNLPPYKNMVLCYKNSFAFKQGFVSIFESSVPSGYTRYSVLDSYFPRGHHHQVLLVEEPLMLIVLLHQHRRQHLI